MRLQLALAAVTVATVTAGCGGGSDSLDPKLADAYVDAQARALCLVQSTAFPTQAELAAAYKHALQASNLSADELGLAQAAARQDPALRKRISNQVTALCG